MSVVQNSRKKRKTERDRTSMRFGAAGGDASYELICSKTEKYAAVLIDYSSGGMCVQVSGEAALSVEQDVFIADGEVVHFCTVRHLKKTDDGATRIGLKRHHTFPLAHLPRRQRACKGFQTQVNPFPLGSVLFATLILVAGFLSMALWLNLAGARDRMLDRFETSPHSAVPGHARDDDSGGMPVSSVRGQLDGRRAISWGADDEKPVAKRRGKNFRLKDAFPGSGGSLR